MATFGEIKARVLDNLADDSLSSVVDGSLGFVNTAMRRLEKKNNLLYMVKSSRTDFGSFSPESDVYTSVSKMKRILSVYYVRDGVKIYLHKLDYEDLEARSTLDEKITAPPTYFAIKSMGTSQKITIELDTIPDDTYTVGVRFIAYSDDLSEDGDENWLTSNAPELLVFGAMLEAEVYIENDERTAIWLAKFNYEVEMLTLLDNEMAFNRDGRQQFEVI